MGPDVLVIGGGPVGCRVAEGTSRHHETYVLEEHPVAGRPVQCAGLVTPRVIRMTGTEEAVLNSLKGARFHFPEGEVVEISSPETKAVVIDRELFDRECRDRAMDAGARYLTNHRFKELRMVEAGWRVQVTTGEGIKDMTAPLLIGADGHRSSVSREAGLRPPREVVRGIEVDLDVEIEDQERVEVFVGNEVAPGFFAWIIPCGEFTRAGLCVSRGTPSSYLGPLLRRNGLDDRRRIRSMAGRIPLGAVPRSYGERIMLVGDAAGQAKPLSGGGIYTGLVSAEHASATAVQAMEEGDLSAKSLSRYEAGWRGDIGKELDRGYKLRRAFLRMKDKKLDELGRILARPDVIEILNTGDIDRQTQIAPRILRLVPSLLKFSPQVLGSLLGR
jgi:geranylgeranyl reductase family protein